MDSKNGLVRYIQAILDLLVMLLSYLIAIKIKFGSFQAENVSTDSRYLILYIMEMFAYLIAFSLFFDNDQLIARNAFQELGVIVKLFLYIIALTTAIIYFTKSAEYYSRIQMALSFSISFVLIFLERQWLKRLITKTYHRSGANEKIMLVTTDALVSGVIAKIKQTRNWYFRITNIALIDKERIGEEVDRIEIVADKKNLLQKLANEEIDSVFLVLPEDMDFDRSHFIQEVRAMGKSVHINIPEYHYGESNCRVQCMGKYAVVSYVEKHYRIRHTVGKRFVDLLVSIPLCLVLFLLWPITALGNALEGNWGNSIVRLVRVGKNGRRFYLRKFRTIHKRTMRLSKTGKFVKALHLEYLPEVWNLLWGDVSLIGAKAPTLPEFLRYSRKHRKSLSMKPGITGSWKISSSPEQADIHYAEHAGIRADLKIIGCILLAAIPNNQVKKENRAAFHKQDEKDEITALKDWMEEREPLEYPGKEQVRISTRKSMGFYLGLKRVFDIVASLTALILLSPLFLLVGILVKWEDGGSVFYGHMRIGQYGKKISIYKFRSMRMNVGNLEKLLTPEQLEQYRKEFKLENDPRVTRIGNILRKTSIDELPQLLNILRGDLSLVGPRPIVEEETKIYEENIAKLLCVKPGLTGYWQAYARNHATYESGERQKMELYYVLHRGIPLDIRILFRTISAVIKRDGAE